MASWSVRLSQTVFSTWHWLVLLTAWAVVSTGAVMRVIPISGLIDGWFVGAIAAGHPVSLPPVFVESNAACPRPHKQTVPMGHDGRVRI